VFYDALRSQWEELWDKKYASLDLWRRLAHAAPIGRM